MHTQKSLETTDTAYCAGPPGGQWEAEAQGEMGARAFTVISTRSVLVDRLRIE